MYGVAKVASENATNQQSDPVEGFARIDSRMARKSYGAWPGTGPKELLFWFISKVRRVLSVQGRHGIFPRVLTGLHPPEPCANLCYVDWFRIRPWTTIMPLSFCLLPPSRQGPTAISPAFQSTAAGVK